MVIQAALDSGACEANSSLVIDSAGTVASLRRFLACTSAFVDQEVRWVQQHDIAAIVADAPDLAGEVAARAEVPSVVCGNSLWDFIYEPPLDRETDAKALREAIRRGYSQIPTMLWLPICHEMLAFNRSSMPLVTAKPQLPASMDRDRLGISGAERRSIVCLGMRGDIPSTQIEGAARGLREFFFLFPPRTGFREDVHLLEGAGGCTRIAKFR